MSDMFDVYWRERGIALERSARRNAANAQAIIDEVAAERDAALKKIDVWRSHYMGMTARAEFLLEELDKAHGGPERNPVRMEASEEITMPRGQREGEPIEFHDRVYLMALSGHVKKHASYLGGWRKLLNNHKIFRLSFNWKKYMGAHLDGFEESKEEFTEWVKQNDRAIQAKAHAPSDITDEADADKNSVCSENNS